MKTSWGKPVHVISFIRTLLIVLAVAVCTVAAGSQFFWLGGRGDAEWQYRYGNFLLNDMHSRESPVKWWRKAAEQGHAQAQYTLGWQYDLGNGVPEDEAEAVKWYRKAAEQGHAGAQWKLGFIYRKGGNGVPENYAEAVKWYRKAVEQGDAIAQHNLGNMYCLGKGVRKNGAEAVKWYRKAAEQGVAEAQYNLGLMYALAKGVPEDSVAAYAWWSVAAASGPDEAREARDSIKDDLTPSQLEKGQVMAREIFERIKKRKAAEGQ